MKKEVPLTFLVITSYPSPEGSLLLIERTSVPGSARERKLSNCHKRAHRGRRRCTTSVKMASWVFTIRNCSPKGFVVFFSLHFGWRARDGSVKLCCGEVGLATDPETDSGSLCGSQKEAAKHVLDKMVVIREPSNRKRTQAATSQDAHLNFTKLFEVTVPQRC